MRLAILSMHTDPLSPLGGDLTGGMNVYVREIAKALSALGVQADVFTRLESGASDTHTPLAPGCRLVRIPAGPARKLDKDAQHAWVEAFARGILAFSEESQTHYDGVSAHYWLSGRAGEILAQTWGVPLALRFHTLAGLKNDALASGGRRESGARLTAEAALARSADALLVSSPAEARAVEEASGVADAHVVPCGVDAEKFRPHSRGAARARLGIAPDGAYVLAVGRIERVKGLDRLIEALAMLTREHPDLNAHLLHVGGVLRENTGRLGTTPRRAEDYASPAQRAEVARLTRLAHRRRVDARVRFLGARPQETLPLFYSAADLLALPSHYESFGIVALEAAACGLPTLAFDVGGVSRAVGAGESGYLVPEGDTAAYAREMARILQGARTFPRAAAWARSFTWTRIAEAERKIWQRLRQPAEATLASHHAS